MNTEKQRLAFVLPEYGEHTHFRYVGEFASALSESLDVALVLEKGSIPEEFPHDHVRVQRFSFAPLRFFEMGLILFSLHRQGYRTHYVHYSFVAGFWSTLLVKLFGGRMFYWNAGMPWLYTRSLGRELFEKTVFRMIDNLLTGADALHEGYAKYYGIAREKIVTLPNWIDVSAMRKKYQETNGSDIRKKLNISDESTVLLFVHRLATRKGAHLLPEIFDGLSGDNRVLVVAGDGPERAALEEAFRSRGVLERVRMLGWVPQERVHELYAIADIFLLPSEEEGFPHVLIEAQAAGVPYVATDVGGVREMTPQDGQSSIVPQGDVRAFIAAAALLLNDAAHSRAFRDSERSFVERYDKKRILARFIEILFPETLPGAS